MFLQWSSPLTLQVALLVEDLCRLCNNYWFVLLNTLSHSSDSWLVSILLSQSFLLCCSQTLDSLYIRCKVVSDSSVNTLTFAVLFLLSFSPVWWPNLLLLKFRSRRSRLAPSPSVLRTALCAWQGEYAWNLNILV